MTVATESVTHNINAAAPRLNRPPKEQLLAEGSVREICALLDPVVGIIDKHSNLPVTRSVLMRRTGAQVSVTATDLETVFSNTARFDGAEGRPAAAAVDAIAMLKVLKGLGKDERVKILVDGGKGRLARGTNSYAFNAYSEEDFPDFVRAAPDAQGAPAELTVASSDLHRGLLAVRSAMAQQDVRNYLNGMLMKVDNGRAHVVGTNGHWLAKYGLEPIATTGTFDVILPRAAVVELAKATKRFDGPVVVSVQTDGQALVALQIGTLRVATRPLAGTYPDIDKVLSDRRERRGVRLRRDETLAALKRLKPATTKQCPGVTLAIGQDRCAMSVKTFDAACSEEMSASYQGVPLKVGINLTYLQDVIGSIDTDTVTLALPQEADRNGWIETTVLVSADEMPSYVAAVMPMRM